MFTRLRVLSVFKFLPKLLRSSCYLLIVEQSIVTAHGNIVSSNFVCVIRSHCLLAAINMDDVIR